MLDHAAGGKRGPPDLVASALGGPDLVRRLVVQRGSAADVAVGNRKRDPCHGHSTQPSTKVP